MTEKEIPRDIALLQRLAANPYVPTPQEEARMTEIQAEHPGMSRLEAGEYLAIEQRYADVLRGPAHESAAELLAPARLADNVVAFRKPDPKGPA